MGYEISHRGIDIIGYDVPIRFYDTSRNLQAEIFLEEDNTLNVGGLISGGDGSEGGAVPAHELDDTVLHIGPLDDSQAPQFFRHDGTIPMTGDLDLDGHDVGDVGVLTLPNTGLHLEDTDASHDLIFAPGSDLSADRTLTITTGDSDRTVTFDGSPTLDDWFDQSVKTGASPEFVGLTLSGLTATRLLATDGADALNSVGDLTSWIAGTANRVTVSDDGDGTATLSGPQDIHTAASPTFANLYVPDGGILGVDGGANVTFDDSGFSVDVSVGMDVAGTIYCDDALQIAGAGNAVLNILKGAGTNHARLAFGAGSTEWYLGEPASVFGWNGDEFYIGEGAAPANAALAIQSSTLAVTVGSGSAFGAQLAVDGGVHVGGTSDPGDDNLEVDGTAGTDNFVSQTTGWQVNYAGEADFRSIFADELHVEAFIADIYSALAGGLIISKSRARVSRNFTIPDTGNTATLYVEDHEGFEGNAVFTANDYVLLRVIDTSGGGLVVTDVWGQVTSYSDLSGGEQSWTFTTTTTSYTDSDEIFAGSIVLDYGATGDGLWRATVLDTYSPYSEIKTWDTVTSGEPDNFTVHVRTGNLEGVTSTAEYGLWAGQGTGDDDAQVTVSDSTAEFRNINVVLYTGGSEVLWLNSDSRYVAINDATYGNEGIQLQYNAGTPRAYIGDGSTEFLKYDGTNISWSAAHTELDAGGDVWFGDTNSTERIEWTSANGVRIFNASNEAVLKAPTSGDVEIIGTLDITSPGEITAADGDILLDEDGITLSLVSVAAGDDTGISVPSDLTAVALTWGTAAAIYGYHRNSDGIDRLRIDTKNDSGNSNDSDVEIRLWNSSGVDYQSVTMSYDDGVVVGDFLSALGGAHVGGTSDPGTDNLVVDGTAEIGDDLGAYSRVLSVGDSVANFIVAFHNENGTDNGDVLDLLGGDSSPACVYVYMRAADYTLVGAVMGDGSGGVNYNSASDIRFKEITGSIGDGILKKISEIKPFRYRGKNAHRGKPENVGFAAQDFQDIPGIAKQTREGRWVMDYSRVTPLLWAGERALLDRIERLEAYVSELEARL